MSGIPASEYVRHIRKAATDATSFVDGMRKVDFLADPRTQNAVVMSLIVIGEAATKVMDRHADFASLHAQVPWRGMRGMRNRIAHGYFDISPDVVRDIVQTALPALLNALPEPVEEATDKNGGKDE
jgi:uncharacterized protein with HEPN domain